MTLFNSAGERVRLLFTGSSQAVPKSLSLSQDALLSGSSSTDLILGSLLTDGSDRLSWSGDNDNGQFVEGGTYYFKAEYSDPFGSVTALIVPVQVIRGQGEQTLEIFNSAGEKVFARGLGLSITAAVALDVGEDGVLAFEYDPATGSALASARIAVRDQDGKEVVLPWDGRNQQGVPVSGGSYTIQVTSVSAGGKRDVISRPVQVLSTAKEPLAQGTIQVVPNPSRGEKPVVIQYMPSPGAYGRARIYNLAGELVAQAADPSRSGQLRAEVQGMAGGIYLIDLESTNGTAVFARRQLKLAIVK